MDPSTAPDAAAPDAAAPEATVGATDGVTGDPVGTGRGCWAVRRDRYLLPGLGLLLLLGAPTAWWATRPPTTVGEVPPPAVAAAPAPTSPTPTPAPPPIVAAPVPTALPVTIRVPAIDVDAVVVSVGLEPDGAMEIPEDVATIGWYDPEGFGGVVPGAPGTAVLSGHVDSRVQGRGAFFDLRLLDVGDLVTVVHDDGTESVWVVTGRTSYPKDVLPFEEIFVWEGPARIALITCGGEFDRAAGSYKENIVVLAEPAPATA